MRKFFLLFGLLASWALHAAAPALDATMTPYDGAASTSHALTAVTVTAGAYGILGLRTNSDGDLIDTVTDNDSNTWSLVDQQTLGGGGSGTSLHVYHCLNMQGGSTTITVGMTGSEILRAVMVSYTGHAGTLNDSDFSVGSGTTVTSPTLTTTGVDRRIISVNSAAGNTTIVPATGETERTESAGRVQIQDTTAASASNYTHTATLGTSLAWASIMVALEPSTSSGGLLSRRRRN